jgi:hemerythrin-like domain-containing protein
MPTLITASARRAPTLDSAGPDPEDPLDFILYEHLRHRVMCNALDALADAERFDAASVARLAEFIRSDLTMHVVDEESVFFPMLRRRCLPEDEIEAALERLNREHEEDRDLSAQVRIFLLTAATEGRPISAIPGAAAALRQFAQGQRRHMMLENAVLIPLARRRLTDEDLSVLGARLAARRRLVGPAPNA